MSIELVWVANLMDVKVVKKWCLYEGFRSFRDEAKHAEKNKQGNSVHNLKANEQWIPIQELRCQSIHETTLFLE